MIVPSGLKLWLQRTELGPNVAGKGGVQPEPLDASRRFSVTAGFYRTCVLDGALEHSPAEHVRRPAVPPESPTLGFTHLQFEALLPAARCLRRDGAAGSAGSGGVVSAAAHALLPRARTPT